LIPETKTRKEAVLSNMQAYVQSHADVIQRVTGINVEIMDSNMIRRERFSLATPIVDGSTIYGVIGLVCFTDEDRARVMDSLDSYRAFIQFVAGALTAKIREEDKLIRATRFLDLMLKVVDAPGQGVLLFDRSGTLIYGNTPAKTYFRLEEGKGELRLEHLQESGYTISHYEEFDIALPCGEHAVVLGRMQQLEEKEGAAATLFAFELPTRLASLVGDLSAGAFGTGFENIVGNSPALRKLKVRALKVADSSSTVLVNGESGTGKELLARAIHQASSRHDCPFIAINCGAMPDTLLESELFGYVSGAFTGASSKGRMGKFELAQGGVIFLDEISAMPLYMQVKLLRVLQERVIIRLGSNKLMHVDVRVIAASNEDLLENIKRHSFREDLYYRLNVIPLTMPPLREREGDIAILAEYFLDKYCSLFSKPKLRLSSAILKIFENYPWPGNVRELEHVIEYAVNMLPEDGRLSLECLPTQFLGERSAGIRPASGTKTVATRHKDDSGDILPLELLEEREIRKALAKFGTTTKGKKEAAGALGLSLATLYRKMQSFSI
jgi:transcriptional regulator with PAS, ATPase and Fis domain